jgi:hypothetical protein
LYSSEISNTSLKTLIVSFISFTKIPWLITCFNQTNVTSTYAKHVSLIRTNLGNEKYVGTKLSVETKKNLIFFVKKIKIFK